MSIPQYVTHNDHDIKVLGSHRGKIITTKEQLFHLFGDPALGRRKSTYHWTIKFLSDGLIITIFDFMGSNEDAGLQESRVWDVGGYRNQVPTNRLEQLGFSVVSS